MTSSMDPGALLPSSNGSGKLYTVRKEESEGQSMENGETRPGHESFHSGLSALLNAVTLQLSTTEDDDDDYYHANGASSTESSAMHNDDQDGGPDGGDESASTPTATPTIVPESHESVKRSFPGVLMTLLLNPKNAEILTFLPDGKFFVIEVAQFSRKLMKANFEVAEFDDFLSKLAKAGFTRIDTEPEGIEVFRHPLFRKGDWETCIKLLRLAEGDVDKDCPPLPPARVVTMDGARNSPEGSAKRRLSPSHEKKLETKPSASHQKPRIMSKSSQSNSKNMNSMERIIPDIEPSPSSHNGASAPRTTSTPAELDSECRCRAQLITADRMSLKEGPSNEPVIEQQAVVGATRTIVSDAIETLLRDEQHTRRTFLKHKETLSKSSLPGVVSIAEQLFSPTSEESPMSDRPDASLPTSRVSPDNQDEHDSGLHDKGSC